MAEQSTMATLGDEHRRIAKAACSVYDLQVDSDAVVDSMYATSCKFSDPLVLVSGPSHVKAQFRSLRMLFREIDFHVDGIGPLGEKLVIEATVTYVPKFMPRACWFTSRECQVGCDLVEALKNHDAEALAGLQTLGTRYGLLQQRAAGASITIFSVKEQTFTFLQVEVARVVRQLKVAAIAPREDARPGSSPQEAVDPADLLM
eukprot:s1796_g13.t2